MRRSRAVAVVTALVLAVTACAADPPVDDVARRGDELVWNDDADLAGLEVAVGSKTSIEQQVLGHLALEALAAAGAGVIDQIALGGTIEVRDAQLGGLIDLYWEYTGTGWVELLREIGPSSDASELAEAVTETDLDENDIAWLTPAPANSSAALARGPNVADGLAVDTIGDLGEALAADVEGLVVCVPEGAPGGDEATGLRALRAAVETDFDPDRVVAVPAEDIVPAVEAGTFCPFGEVGRTSPQLIDADVQLLEDDVGAFLIRNPTVTVRAEILAQFPQLADVLDPVAAALTDEQLRALNAAVAEGEEPRAVARAWLVDQGLADR